MEQALAAGRRIAWLSLTAAVVALIAASCAIFVHVISLTENTLRTGTLVAVGRRISRVFDRTGRPEAWIGYAKCELGFTYSPHNATLRVTIFSSGREPLRRQGRHPPWRRPGFLFAEARFHQHAAARKILECRGLLRHPRPLKHFQGGNRHARYQ